MSSFTIRVLTVVVPLIMLVSAFGLSEIVRKHHGKRVAKRMVAGALKGLAHGPDIRI